MAFLGITVYDEGGNNNGLLDPGETADLTMTLKNIGGVDFTDLNTMLYSSDSYITINDNAGYFGSLPIDSTRENTGDRYTVTADVSAPEGHIAHCQIIANENGFLDTLEFIVVIGKKHYYLWNPDPTPVPGQNMDNILQSQGYSGDYGTDLATDMNIYKALLVTLGVYPNEYIITSGSAEANTITNFLQNGGRVYMEGVCWYIDPVYFGGHDFNSLFGLTGLMYYYNAMGPLVGQTSTFTTGMSFTYSGEVAYYDYVNATGTGFLIFDDTDNGYHVAIANDAATYRTVASCFELGLLNDATPPSTRAALLDSIMTFFGINIVGIEDFPQELINNNVGLTSVYPNPCTKDLMISYAIASPTNILLTIHDVTGRLVKTVTEMNQTTGRYSLTWHARDENKKPMPAGVYFVRLQADNVCSMKKFVLMK